MNVSAEEMLNSTVMEVSEELCPGLTDWENKFIAYLGYYVEGVLILVTSIIGITINLVSSIIILTRSEMRNCFNILLVGNVQLCFNFTLDGVLIVSYQLNF